MLYIFSLLLIQIFEIKHLLQGVKTPLFQEKRLASLEIFPLLPWLIINVIIHEES